MVRRAAPHLVAEVLETVRMDQFKSKVAPADGKLAVLLPGMGAVATTFIAGVEAVKAGLGKPIGSLTQMAHVRLGKRSEKRWAMIKDLVPLARLKTWCSAAGIRSPTTPTPPRPRPRSSRPSISPS